MTDYSDILGGSDNLWKYLFTVGVLLISLSIFYPLRKSEEINLKIIELKTDSELIAKKIDHLKKDQMSFEKYLELSGKEIDSLKIRQDSIDANNQIKNILNEISQEKKIVKDKIRELEVLIISNFGKESYIRELKSQSERYNLYFALGLWVGIILVIVGLLKWIVATIASDKLRWKELNENEFDFLKKSLPNWISRIIFLKTNKSKHK